MAESFNTPCASSQPDSWLSDHLIERKCMTADEISGKLPATLIPGDGIGPEIVKSAVDILEALGSPFEWEIRQGGLAAIKESHDPLPQTTLDSIRRTRLALKGPLTTPVGGGFRSINVRLREEFGLYANVRPVPRDDSTISTLYS
jgi:isocitrate/isopropylmalate dehydrogenase